MGAENSPSDWQCGRDIDTLKENSLSARKPALVECWGRNLIKIKGQMRGKEAEVVSVGNAFQVLSCSVEQIKGSRSSSSTWQILENIYIWMDIVAKREKGWKQRRKQSCGERSR